MDLNFKPWDYLLHKYVNNLGQVDYQGWKMENPTTLPQWLTQLTQIDLCTLELEQLLAFWLNLYNALTILQVLDRYPFDSVFPKILGIPNLIAFVAFFQRSLWSSAGHRYSLNQIEHRILRPQFNDPRIHFALVCASVGCPRLRPEAHRPDKVKQQLSEDTHRFINDPTKVRYLPEQNCLYVSAIFRWYRQDFAKVTPYWWEYIGLYLNVSLSDAVSIRYLPYDWNLNKVPS